MELRLESRTMHQALDAVSEFFEQEQVVACMGDRFALSCLCMTEPIRRSIVGAATTEDEGFELVQRHRPSVLICSSDLESGYGIELLRRVKREWPSCKLMILLVRETQAVVQEALGAFADAVIFKSSLGTGQGDFVQALATLAEGGVFAGADPQTCPEAPRPDLPPLIEQLSERELEITAAVARGLTKTIAASLGLGGNEDPRGECHGQARARDRTQLAVLALLYGLIDPMG